MSDIVDPNNKKIKKKSEWFSIIGVLLFIIIVICLGCGTSFFISQKYIFKQSLPIFTTALNPIIGFCLVMFSCIGRNLLGSYTVIKKPEQIKYYSAIELLVNRWLSDASDIFIIVMIGINHTNGLTLLGIHFDQWGKGNGNAIQSGFILMYGLVIVFGIGSIIFTRIKKSYSC